MDAGGKIGEGGRVRISPGIGVVGELVQVHANANESRRQQGLGALLGRQGAACDSLMARLRMNSDGVMFRAAA